MTMASILHAIEIKLRHSHGRVKADHGPIHCLPVNVEDPNNDKRKSVPADLHSDASHSVSHDDDREMSQNCTRRRVYIREGKAKCLICLFHSNGNAEHCNRDNKGCPGCQVAVCRKHWKEYDHHVDRWV
jgi:hypothetical protein